MRKKLASLLLVSGLFLGVATSASAASVHLLGGLNFATPSIGGGSDSRSQFSFGGLLDVGGPFFEFETGVLSHGNKYASTVTSTEYSYRSIEVPLLLRVSFSILSVGGGLYYENFGDAERSGGTAPAQNFGSNTLGLKFGGRASIPIAPLVGWDIDLSWKHGFLDRDPSGGHLRDSSFTLLTGISLGF